MFFAGEDELAIHTVTSAAYGLLKDLKARRCRDEAADNHLTSIFYAVRDYKRGTLPANLMNDSNVMQLIEKVAAALPIQVSSKFEDVRASISPEMTREFWQKRNKVSNFLKHADRDSEASLAIGDVDNLMLLMQASSAYIDIMNDNLGAEGMVLCCYFSVTRGTKNQLPEQLQSICTALEELKHSERLDFCSSFIRELNASNIS
ncbi:MAG TPA: hypothetical protein PLG02_02165 [Methylotenera sp.]|nr:hypothetical protein [Methylotenera sp.]